ncbi:MAG TPA: CaiB/BaiF CoA-transferase family protein [Myxococcota bacterium]|nr:CaiB/BaiF CoA-transferase family protein [Myxococcota bacterium]
MASDPAAPPALAGVTVLDLSTVGPASRCTRILADYGAAVVKVGAPPKRSGVQIEPSFFAYAGGRGTKRVRLDLKAPAGKAAFLRLAQSADVVVESFRPGVAARLGIGPDDVRRANPRVVYCSTSGYGQEGPAAGWAGHDLNYLALGGFLACSTPGDDGAPPLPGATIADGAAGGMHAAIAVLAALVRRAATGEGATLDVAVADGVLSLMALVIDEHLATGADVGPGHDLLTGRYACYGVYRCRDGRWLSVAAIEPAFYANLCRALGLEAFLERQLEDAAQPALRSALARALVQRDRDEWVAKLSAADTCVAPVLAVDELARDPHFTARGAVVEAEHPRAGRFRQLGPVLAGAGPVATPVALRDGGETDTDALLAAAGYTPAELAALRREGVIA